MSKLIPAAAYIRMSTDKQEESPARQRAEIEKLAVNGSYQVVRWYEDHGKTGTESAKRSEFQKLLKDAQGGAFQAVLMYEQSRLSREDVFDAIAHFKLFRDAGVKLVTCQRGEMRFDDLGGLLTAVVGQHEARSESLKIAERCVSGKRNKLRQGKRHNNAPTFGYDRQIFDASGAAVSRIHFRDRFVTPRGWSIAFVPSADVAAVDGIRWAFKSAADGVSIHQIVAGMNKRGLLTVHGKPFGSMAVKRILTNPVYVGDLRAGAFSDGKFSRLDADGVITIKDAHKGIVTRELFQRAQEALSSRCFTQRNRGRYPLRMLLKCAHCGYTMVGTLMVREGSKNWRCYVCRNPDCPMKPHLKADRIETAVLRAVRDDLCAPENRQRLIETDQHVADVEPVEVQQLAEVRSQIERANRNLALAANDADFAAVSSVLADLRERESELRRRIAAATPADDNSIAIAAALRAFDELAEEPGLADTALLVTALRTVVRRVSVGREQLPGSRANRWFGTIDFCEGVAPHRLTDADIGCANQWKQAVEAMRGKTMTADQLGSLLGIRKENARQLLVTACRRGFVARDCGRGLYRGLLSPTHR